PDRRRLPDRRGDRPDRLLRRWITRQPRRLASAHEPALAVGLRGRAAFSPPAGPPSSATAPAAGADRGTGLAARPRSPPPGRGAARARRGGGPDLRPVRLR